MAPLVWNEEEEVERVSDGYFSLEGLNMPSHESLLSMLTTEHHICCFYRQKKKKEEND